MKTILKIAVAAAMLLPVTTTNASQMPLSMVDARVTNVATATASVPFLGNEGTQVAHRKKYKRKHRHKRYKCRPGQHIHASRNYCHSHGKPVVQHCPRNRRCVRNSHGDIIRVIATGAVLYGIFKHLEDKF